MTLKGYIVALILFVGSITHAVANQRDSLLKVLDNTISQKQLFDNQKEDVLINLKKILAKEVSNSSKFRLLGDVFNQYLYYNTDSARYYADLRYSIAQKTNDAAFIYEARLNQAAVKSITGMFKEAIDALDNLVVDDEYVGLVLYKWQLYSSLYEAMHYYSVTENEKLLYLELSNSYRDSILINSSPQSGDYVFNNANILINNRKCDEAVSLLEDYFSTVSDNDRNRAIAAYMLYNAWMCAGNKDKAVNYLIISSISDIKSSTKEYISLWTLAEVIYREGELDRAYNYLKCSLDDATFSKARLRTIKITELFSVIESAYQHNRDRQHARMVILIIIISVLLLIVAVAVVYSRRQVKKLKVARNEIRSANKRLSFLNAELESYNIKLRSVNESLSESNAIKEEYVGRFMDLSSAYLDKMDEYRRTLSRKATTGSMDDVVNELKSTNFIKNELKEFYNNFDHAFLKLFPTFIDEFNLLLQPDEQVSLKPNELLNTELRVFALIRLGITDSEKIAKFLRYSVTTIYNYRTKMRNKAAGNRAEFDDMVMRIGG